MMGRQANVVMDLCGLEPPEPLVRALAALDRLGPEESLLVFLPHEPYPLYRALEVNGFSWQTTIKPDGTVEVLIRHCLP